MFMGEIMGIFGAGLFVVYALPIPAGLYLFLRWRSQKEQGYDPELGFKFVFAWLRFLGILDLLIGLTGVVYGILASDEGGSMRVPLAMVVSGLFIVLINTVLLAQTNHQQFSLVHRIFTGLILLMTGSAFTIGFIWAIVASIEKSPNKEMIKLGWTITVIWGASFILTQRYFKNIFLGQAQVNRSPTLG